jgi:hypothetical protein
LAQQTRIYSFSWVSGEKRSFFFFFLEILEIYVSALNFFLSNGLKLFEKLFKQSTQANIHFENHKTSQAQANNTMNFLLVTMLFGWFCVCTISEQYTQQTTIFNCLAPKRKRKKRLNICCIKTVFFSLLLRRI